VDYKEGILVGYRSFDTKQIEPQFPFGYGLSYTTFGFKKLNVMQKAGGVTVAVTVKNTGKTAGAETVQLYVREMAPVVARPVHELKEFRKIRLAPGETREVEFDLGREAFSYFSPDRGSWIMQPGRFEIQIGESSRDLRLRKIITVPPLAGL
jgi:beta-glucosidase